MNLLKKKSVWFGALLLLVLGGATLFIIYKELNGNDIAGTLRHADPRWVTAAVAAMILYSIADGLNIRRCLRLTGYEVSIPQMMKYAFAGFFFSSITPSSSGGQPGQLYFMYRDKIKLSHGTFSLLCAFLSYQIMAVVWGIIGLIFTPKGIMSLGGKFSYVFPIGFAINLVTIAILISILFSRRMTIMFAYIALRFNRKNKNPGSKNEIMRFFARYRKAAGLMNSNKRVFVKILLTSFVQMSLFHSVPYLCARALGCDSFGWFTGVCTQGALFLSVSSLPLPGAAGVTEYGFALFFADLIPKHLMGSTMILSRFCSFLFPLIVSGSQLLLLQLSANTRRPIRKASR
ncbi:lysylphosphatidylglycerol synthase transmembrane domain-containing protein [Oribacterium sp. NK2B42]|uniref:lysylphosphatidylglycerol synthase transmembrane domain-containing protein n=1 Tax=Oribacterium sp. NK2B42 TaxID=689781 RepID=UPI0004154D55|nr:lysylphosphatidylglycerol synthase transmembrane domain-containing protein [Oribacterium sp. NK2B42]